MRTIIAASGNQHKIREIAAITKKFGMTVISRDEAGLDDREIEEDGRTFEENSYKKAYAVMKMSGGVTIADDSGLEVEILGGEPGVFSARYAGESCDDERNNIKLLAMLEGVPYSDRRARFVSVITMVYPDGETLVARGECNGHILDAPAGNGGFGYDPLFVPEGYQETFAQMSQEEKNKISHRAKALEKLEKLLEERKTRMAEK